MSWHITEINSHSFAVSDLLARAPYVYGVTLRQWHTDNLGDDNSEEYNLSFSVALDASEVRESRMFAAQALGFEPRQMIFPAQVHGADVRVVGAKEEACGALSSDTAVPDCDALVTDTPGLLLGITVEDCLPLFFFDPLHNAIGIAHSGWRGMAGRIANRTIELMTASFGTDPTACLVAMGPDIGPEGYEVDENVYAEFQAEDNAAPGVFPLPVPVTGRSIFMPLSVINCTRQAFRPHISTDLPIGPTSIPTSSVTVSFPDVGAWEHSAEYYRPYYIASVHDIIRV